MSSYYSSSASYYDAIMAEIARIPGPKSVSNKATVILCPFHHDKTPSGRIRHVYGEAGIGNFRCYACGAKERWNGLAAVLNLKQFGKDSIKLESQAVPSTNFDKLDEVMIAEEKGTTTDIKLYDLDNEKVAEKAGCSNRRWRGYGFKFLKKVGCQFAKVTYDSGFSKYYVHLPIIVKGKTKGYINAQIKKPEKKFPSYLNSKGSWSLSSGLFPYDYTVSMMKENGWKTLVLVEGPRDALRLLKFGIPAVCIMGTQSWSKKKMQLLEFSGAERIILMFDGDKAGKAATKLVKTGIQVTGDKVADPLKSVFNIKIVRLWQLEVPEDFEDKAYDPGNCPEEILEQVLALVK